MPKFTLLATKMEVCLGIPGGDFRTVSPWVVDPPMSG